ncbi:hypothetical protein Vi05172_g6962 [Venturia inaequalis]|nr:hypothetical protein Vi05172_g6962 [Venturia inaequalis]
MSPQLLNGLSINSTAVTTASMRRRKRARETGLGDGPGSIGVLIKNITTTKTTFLTLPAELRQKTLSYTHTDKDLTDNLRMVVDLDSKWALKTVYMPDVQPGLATIWAGKLSTVHFVIAQDMEWVEEAWKKRGGALAETQTRLDAKRDDWDADYTSSPRWREIFKARKV